MDVAAHKKPLLTGVYLACIAGLYLVGILIMSASVDAPVRDYLAAVAYPIDCMVILPALFYVLVVRRHGLSPVFVLPVMWAGGVLAAAYSSGASLSLVFALGAVCLVVEAVVAITELRRLVRAFLQERAVSADPVAWFEAPIRALTGSERAARFAAHEPAMVYYALFSWRKKAVAAPGASAFTYHRNNGSTALVGVVAALLPIETFVVHLLVAQWSDLAAWALTLASVYSLVWIVGGARASALRPVVLSEASLSVNSGLWFSAEIPLGSIAAYQRTDPGFDKAETANLGSMGNANGWLVLDEPVEVSTFTGAKRSVRAIGLELDDQVGFARKLNEALVADAHVPRSGL